MNANQKRYEDLIKRFKKKCATWNSQGIKTVFNEDLYCVQNIDDVKYIVVADNPGENEKTESRYLCESNEGNRSGHIARCIFSMIFRGESYLVLNKTPIFTPKTADLKGIQASALKETMEYMADLIYDINRINKHIQVYIFGIGKSFNSKKNCFQNRGIWKYFFARIKTLYNVDRLKWPIIAKHFSIYSLFQDFIIEDTGEKMKFHDLCNENAKDFLKAMGDLLYRNWLKNA